MRNLALLISVASTAITAPAWAQSTAPAPGPVAEATRSDTETSDAAPQNAGDIVVTATRRAERLADVPVAVSAVSTEQLQLSGANDIRQLNQLAPSLLVSSTGSEANTSARIRGIGTVGDNPGLESSVAVFIDGVYRSRSGVGMNELGEVERVEVLRGPQGTLSGRNASAGVINIITKQPSFRGIEGMSEFTYGNYDTRRVQGALNVPFGETVAARIDGVWSKRDGFYNDPANNTTVNDRDRYFLRGQLRFEPTSDFSVRLIGDYTKRDERCCAATYVDRSVNQFVGNLNDPASPLSPVSQTGNNIINVIRDLGQNVDRVNNAGYSRTISTTAGRGFGGQTEDWGVSGQVDWNLGAATLTSITAYRDYNATQGSDTDYSSVDILYRAANGNSGREFKTFSQELRLQGEAFGGKLDWLIGGYYADEDLTVVDNLRFGAQYGRFATCRLVSGALGAFYSPTSAGCLSPTGRAVLSGVVPGVASPFGAAGPSIVAGIDRLDAINDRGSTRDVYFQNSRNFAAFTHNIIHFTDTLDLTLGLRYTNERKRFNAAFTNDNTGCTANQAALAPLLANAGLATVVGGILGLSCQGNSTAELNGVTINDRRSESEFTGTAVLSYKPTDALLVYGSFSRGYKAGGFNLDRSALRPSVILPFGGAAAVQGLVGNLQFDQELVDAYEVGAKYSRGAATITLAGFRQEFSNFQLNTFNGTVFLVATINACKTGLNGADRDLSNATGACAADDVTYGVVSQGIELETSLTPTRYLNFNLGITYADTKYRDNLVGSRRGAPLDSVLRVLPGNRMSNAPEWVATSSFAWTPPIGDTGLSGLFYMDGRLSDNYNTGSDLFPQKIQDSFFVANARVGIRGPREWWALEFWGQNIFNKDYAQVAFNSPFQQGAGGAPFVDPQYPGGRQIFSQYLAEPRTYGVTGRVRF